MEPGTRPPPSTRSSSPIPVVIRSAAPASTSASLTGRTARLERLPPPAGAAARCSSTKVFHSPQPGQRPCHFGLSWPQAEQAKRVEDRAMQRG